MSPLSQLANTLSRVNGAMTAYRNLSKLIGKNYNTGSSSQLCRSDFNGEIEFQRTYPSNLRVQIQPVLKNLSFKIPAGQKVALVGKWVLVNLLCHGWSLAF